MQENDFTPHEVVVFSRALTWFDVEDKLRREAEGLAGREKDAKLKAAGDAATTGLRFWRTLKLRTPPSRRAAQAGRPANPNRR